MMDRHELTKLPCNHQAENRDPVFYYKLKINGNKCRYVLSISEPSQVAEEKKKRPNSVVM